MDNRIIHTVEDDALFAFDAANNVEPHRTVAKRIAAKYGVGPTHSLVDDIAHAVEDAMTIGERRGPFVRASIASHR